MQDPIELMESWHANECLGMLDRLMRDIPPEGGHVSKEIMEQLLGTAFLTGAICQQDRPLLAVVPFPLNVRPLAPAYNQTPKQNGTL
ncbi:MAG: hypothetical protein H8M99_01525 [Gloeobacteraceae cyanobacterium ES-bin-144]|nr:hypothetical protein [Verrucomicrobiales bacterium]